ncbi:talin-1-like [Brevipalpus obovatus]|uniref:talin-1-like n=1 Tax=Brevipalpus obovatus TaxID=246614 RepID=UPI003D9F0229
MTSSQLSLKISVPEHKLAKTLQFAPDALIIDVCRTVRDKLSETTQGVRRDDSSQSKDFGLFLTDEDPKKGVWLENGRTLDYYMLRNGDVLEYKRKTRTLRVRMLDGTVKTVLVDDSQNVANLMVVICTKIGITNHDEYSLVREYPEEKENSTFSSGTLTLRRGGKDKTIDSKMEQLKKKLKTDDDLNWVDHSMTLREQGIDEDETLLLRRKFFFSDQNIDSRDPVQLNLLYVQTRDAIIAGTHPVTFEEACQFAGIQCQIQFGDHIESKHRPGFLDAKEFLPKDYAKVKGIEKKIFLCHMKHAGLSDLEAKVEYVKLARSLKTYGVTFFLVKEKKRRKNKLVPRLLGVNKDSVLRLDEKTKEILQTWPLTAVKRWAASPNSFTLDFGDYSDSYYSVQTSEGEQIARLIAGYIDIILKRKKAKDHFGIDGDEGSTMVEDSVSPYKATIMQHQTAVKPTQAELGNIALPAVVRAVTNGPQSIVTKEIPPAQITSVKGQAHHGHKAELPSPKRPQLHSPSDRLGPQKALFTTMKTSFVTIERVQHELGSKERSVPKLGNDQGSLQWKRSQVDVRKQTLVSQLSAMNAATAKIVSLTSVPEEEMDTPALGAAVSTISSNLPEMTRDIRVLASLLDDSERGENLIEAAKNLCNAFSELLRAAESGTQSSRKSLLSAAVRVGESSHYVLTSIHEREELEYTHREAASGLQGIAKNVATATAALVMKAKAVTSKCEKQDVDRVINSATQCALATSQLVTCAKVVAPTIQNASCQRQLTETCKEVSRSVERTIRTCESAVQDEALNKDLQEAATAVITALNSLLAHIRTVGDRRTSKSPESDGAVDIIFDATDRLFSSTGDASEMVRQAKILAQATTQLIVDIKSKVSMQQDSEVHRRLLAAAKVLADATNRLMEAAKGCASNPHDSVSQAALRKAAEDLRNATNTAAGNALRKKVIVRLESSARQSASAATQNIAAIRGSIGHIENGYLREEMETVCGEVLEYMAHMVQGIRGVQRSPSDVEKQSRLIQSCEQFLEPASKLIELSKSAIPHVSDQSFSIQMRNASQEMAETVSELKFSITKAQEACFPSFEISNAISVVRELIEQVEEYKRASDRGTLLPLPGDNAEKCFNQLGSDCKVVGSILAQLLTAASHGNDVHTSAAAQDTINALRDLIRSIRGVLACSGDTEHRSLVSNSGLEVLEKSISLFEETKWALENLNDKDRQAKLSSIAHSLSSALNNCVNCLPMQRDVDEAIETIKQSGQTFTKSPVTSSMTTNGVRSYNEVQSNLNAAASKLNESASKVVGSSRYASSLATVSKQFSTAFQSFSKSGLEMINSLKDQNTKNELLTKLESLTSSSSELLTCAKSVASDPHSSQAKSSLTTAARALSDAITSLLNVCNTAEAPGQKEVDLAIRNIQMMRPILDNPVEPVNNSTYFDCLDSIMEVSRRLGDAMTSVRQGLEKNSHEEFSMSIKESADSVCGLIENAAQSAYLVGAADPSSVAGRPGLVDINAFHKGNDSIRAACKQLINPDSNQQQILSAATIIAKHTSALCDSCRSASNKTTNQVVKRQFVQSAKDVANATATLVKEIKALDLDPKSEANRRNCAAATRPLTEALENLLMFASASDFAGIPARISEKAKLAQTPIVKSGKMIIDNFCSMLNVAKTLSRDPKDASGWASFASHSKNVSDSIKSLVSSIKESSPGQKECAAAIDKTRRNIRELDQASFTLGNQTLRSRRDEPIKTLREMMHSTLNEIGENIDPVRITGKCEAENIGHTVASLFSHFDSLVQNAINCAAKAGTTKLQMNLLDQTKTVCECALQLLYAVKECGGNPRASSVHSDIDDACEALREAIQDLTHTLQSSSGETQVSGLVDSLTKSISRVDERHSMSNIELVRRSLDFVDYQTKMVNVLREITRTSQEISSKSITQVNQLGPLVNNLVSKYSSLATDASGAISATNNVEIASRIRSSIQELGTACVHLTRAAGIVQNDSSDAVAQRDVADQSKSVSEKTTFVLAALQAGSRGTQACINAASTVSGIIGDLDTTIMFATAGTLNPDNDEEVFSSYRDSILRSAKALVDDTKSLVVGAASNQEQLADAAQNAVTTIVQLSDTVKLGAASLGAKNSEAQVLLLNAVKDVASALGELVQATKDASGKHSEDFAMNHLKESAKVMITNVTSLLKTVKIVEDEHQRGTRALEATIEAIGQEIRLLESPDPPNKKCSPENLARVTKPVTLATAKAVAAGTSAKQEDIIVAANMGRKAIYDLLITSKQAAYGAESREMTNRISDAGKSCALKYRELLQLVHTCIQRSTGATHEEKQALMEMSRNIASSLTEIVSNAEMLKGTDWVDPDDPTVIAETELLGAASSIEAAAKKLASLQPRRTSVKITDDDQELNFDEMILDAAKSIAAASSALVRAASAAQRELVTTGKVSSRPISTSDDGQWSEGLISAARHVAAATHSLVEAANALVQGYASEEKLISSAKQVASSTAQLLVACKVKADPDSKSMTRLQGAGNAVKKATDNLVKAAQQAIEHEEEQSLVLPQKGVPGIAQEILAREEILKKERELNDARLRLAVIRKAKYNKPNEESHEYHLTESTTLTSSSMTSSHHQTTS